ncbi:MAG: response regulator [Anaerolineaceae bacterium]|jgi:DNA-binding response OmpR family regulator|nr:response regulator [Anaerolineaceae bacterium]
MTQDIKKQNSVVKKGHILVVDDDQIILRLVEATFLMKGYYVRTANNAKSGLVKALSETPDLILLDYMMPERNGLELLKDLRAVPELSDLPVIMLTADGSPEIVSRAIQTGVNDYIVKPINIPRLVERVQKWLPAVPTE